MDSQEPGSFVFVIVGNTDGMKQGFFFHIFPETLKQSGLEFCRSCAMMLFKKMGR